MNNSTQDALEESLVPDPQDDFFEEFDAQASEEEQFQIIENNAQDTPKQNKSISYVKSALRGGMKAGSILAKTFVPSTQKLNQKEKEKDGTSSQKSGTNKTNFNQQALYDEFYEAPEDVENLLLPDVDSDTKPDAAPPKTKIQEQDFVSLIDPKVISIKVIKYSKKYYLISEGSFLIEIDLKGQSELPTLQVKRTYEDFCAFHMALSNRFKNIKFPEFPKSSSVQIIKGQKLIEMRIEIFQKLFDQILLNAQQYESLKAKFLSILYKFVIQEAQIKDEIVSNSGIKGRKNSSPIEKKQRVKSMHEPVPQQIDLKNQKTNYFNKKQLQSLQKTFETVQDVTNQLSKVQEKLTPLDSVQSPRAALEQMEFKEPELFDAYAGDQIGKRSQSMNNDITKGISFNGNRSITNPSTISFDANAEETKLDSSNNGSQKRQKNSIESTVGFMKQDIKDQYKIAKDQINQDSLGKVYVKFPKFDEIPNSHDFEPQWEPYHAKFENVSQLLFLKDINKNSFHFNYIVYRCIIKQKKEIVWDESHQKMREIDALMIFHKYDTKPILLTIPQIFESLDENTVPSYGTKIRDIQDYKRQYNIKLLQEIQRNILMNSLIIPENTALQNQITQMHGGIAFPIDKTSRYPTGKLMLEIKDVQNFEWTSENQNLYVRITCHPYVLYSKRVSKIKRDKNLMTQQFRQIFYLPIHSYFSTLTIELVNQINKGWFRDYQQEFVLARYDIRIPDISALQSDKNDGYVRLPLDEFQDYKKFGLRPVVPVQSLVKTEQASLMVRIIDLTRAESMFQRNPNRDIIEDRKQKDAYLFKDMSLVLARTKMVIYYFEWFLQIDTFIYQFHYPKFSWFAYVLLIIFINTFDPQYLLSYLVLIAFLIVFAHSDYCRLQISPFLSDFFFSEKEKHPLMRDLNQIKKQEDIHYISLVKQLREEQTLPEELKQMQQDYNIQEKRGYWSKFWDFKKGTAQTLNFIDRYCDYFEKYKNLIQWEDPRMTNIFYIVVIIGFLIVTFLPLRFFMTVSYTYKFYKGQYWNNKRQRNNQEICRIELQNLFDDMKIRLEAPPSKKKQPESPLKESALDESPDVIKKSEIEIPKLLKFHSKIDLNELEWGWEKIIKGSKRLSGNSYKMREFENKFLSYFQRQFTIYLPKDLLKKECKCPKDLIHYFGTTLFVLRPRVIRNEDEIESNSKIYKRNTPFYMYLPIFVMNRVPSDLYRLKNPKLEIKSKNGYHYVEQKKAPTVQKKQENSEPICDQTHESQIQNTQTVKQQLEQLNLDNKKIRDFRKNKRILNKSGLAISKIEDSQNLQMDDIYEEDDNSCVDSESDESFDEKHNALLQDLIDQNNRESSEDDFKDFD